MQISSVNIKSAVSFGVKTNPSLFARIFYFLINPKKFSTADKPPRFFGVLINPLKFGGITPSPSRFWDKKKKRAQGCQPSCPLSLAFVGTAFSHSRTAALSSEMVAFFCKNFLTASYRFLYASILSPPSLFIAKLYHSSNK